MGDKNVALMTGHGIAAAGNCIEQSTLNALGLERLAKMNYKAYAIGTPHPIPEADQRAPREVIPEGGRRPRGSCRRPRRA